MFSIFAEKIFHIKDASEFENATLELFKYHFEHNSIYRNFCNYLDRRPANVASIREIPFLPIQAFRIHKIILTTDYELLFESSTTTSSIVSRHYVAFATLYEKSFTRVFQMFYGDPSAYVILALLPSYLERPNSSLVYMCRKLIELSQHPESGFYLSDFEKLYATLKELSQKHQPAIFIGVSFALLDFAERYQLEYPELIVIETGGMKGRREEIIRKALHETLQQSFIGSSVESEYGMTELLTQAYARDGNHFQSAPWMKVFVRDVNDPISLLPEGKMGVLNIIDLANIYSCPFIATDDIGIVHQDGTFEVLGRLDHAEMRGCNLMYEMSDLL